MSQSIRQAELFAGQDWTVIYRAFNKINFNSYDPPSINAALREYIQTNYPEEYNDWIESSEFVAIIDLLSWLAGSLAFRTDVNARENFLETAIARESVLRLARFLSYNPRRTQSARGMVKIVEVRTTENILDSFGTNLSNQAIRWNDPDNIDWMEQFTLVLNAVFPTTNPFGVPLKQGTLGGASTQLYRMNTLENPDCVYSFDASIDGSRDRFELVNVDFEDGSGFSERNPNPDNGFHLVYRNDGRGNDSTRTGFFMFFKQGILRNEIFSIKNQIENRVIDINNRNTSESDVWVNTIDDYGSVITIWDKVPAIFSENITFNEISSEVRNIYSVITRDRDEISLRFSDGRFGAVPIGNLRVWYRQTNGKQYQVRPRDMERIPVIIPYMDRQGRAQQLTVTISLQESISNALAAESIESIRFRAPQVYGTQNRMVSGEDYNVLPLTSNEIVKMRAVNRVYSGHSRYIDINDPTATFQDTVVMADDGIIYQDKNHKQYTQVALSVNLSSAEVIANKIQPMLSHSSVVNYFVDYCMTNKDLLNCEFIDHDYFVWRAVTNSGNNSKGYFDGSIAPSVDATCPDVRQPFVNAPLKHRVALMNLLGADSKLRFEWVDAYGKKQSKWATVAPDASFSSSSLCAFSRDIIGMNDPITIDENIPDGAVLRFIVPPYRHRLDNREMLRDDLMGKSEMGKLDEFVALRKPFQLWYVVDRKSSVTNNLLSLGGKWLIVDPSEKKPEGLAIHVLSGSYNNGMFWSFETHVGTRYIFESSEKVVWANLTNHSVLDGISGMSKRDTISVVWPEYALGQTESVGTIDFEIVDNVYDPDGMPDYRKVVITPVDKDLDGYVDIPDAVDYVASIRPDRNKPLDFALFRKVKESQFYSLTPLPHVPVVDSLVGLDDDLVFLRGSDSESDPYRGFYRRTNGEYEKVQDDSLVYFPGKMDLRFKWKHYADTNTRIDPAISNIIDIFVLTSEYDYLTRKWIREGALAINMPEPPTDVDLMNTFDDLQQYKMFSDQIIWRPVKYKPLFGEGAAEEVRAQFKIVRLASSALSDGEIRSNVINVINEYFSVNNWEFGETFYFTELAAYIHMRMATAISSVVIVPLANNGTFGELFEVRCATDELFISTAQVSDVVIIDNNTKANLRIT